MSDQPARLTTLPAGYAEWLTELKSRIHSVNRELVLCCTGRSGATSMRVSLQ